MRILLGEERKEIDIPIHEIIQDGGVLNILPSVKNYFSIDYKPKNDKLTLVAGGYIGLIPINNNLAIEIRPKFSISNLARIVDVAEDNFKTLDFFSKTYQKTDDFNSVVFEFFAESLEVELKKLSSEGVMKNYLSKKEESQSLRGRLNINDSIKLLWSHGKFNKASITYFDFTSNNPFNRLIKLTLNHCIKELNFIQTRRTALTDSLIEFYSMFDTIPLDFDLRNLDYVINAIDTEKITDLRKYYINICGICRLILNKMGVVFDQSGVDFELNSFTLDMAIVFERYLLNSLRLNRNIFPENTIILDGNKEGKKKLYNQPSKSNSEAKPDVIIKVNNENKIIIDAKYKLKSKEEDRYQVVTHALSYGANIAVLILPKSDSSSRESFVKLGSIGDAHRITIYEYYYDLAAEDLAAEEIKFSQYILTHLLEVMADFPI